jgi:hypothetical protein
MGAIIALAIAVIRPNRAVAAVVLAPQLSPRRLISLPIFRVTETIHPIPANKLLVVLLSVEGARIRREKPESLLLCIY